MLPLLALGLSPGLSEDFIGRAAGLAFPCWFLRFVAGDATNAMKKPPAGFEQVSVRLNSDRFDTGPQGRKKMNQILNSFLAGVFSQAVQRSRHLGSRFLRLGVCKEGTKVVGRDPVPDMPEQRRLLDEQPLSCLFVRLVTAYAIQLTEQQLSF